MGGGTQTGDRSAFIQIVDDRLHGLVIRGEEADEEKKHVGILQDFRSGDFGGTGLDVPIVIQPEKHGALEPVTLGQNPSKRRAGLFPPVFVIACNEDDVLTLAGAGFTLVDQRVGKDG